MKSKEIFQVYERNNPIYMMSILVQSANEGVVTEEFYVSGGEYRKAITALEAAEEEINQLRKQIRTSKIEEITEGE